MGDVAVLVKVFPEDMQYYDSIKEELRKSFRVGRMDDEPVAFGFKCLKVVFIMPDKEGSGGLEEKIKEIKGVSEVQVEEVSLI